MGICQSADKRINDQIDIQMRNHFAKYERKQKLLLLGAGESGKSTILKQIRLLHRQGFDVDERLARKGVIYSNIITAMATMMTAMDELNIKFDSPVLQVECNLMLRLLRENRTMDPLTEDVVVAVKRLWADGGVQRCYDRRAEYQLDDCTQFFIESINRIAADDYIPSDQDMLYSRVPTTGAVQLDFSAGRTPFRVFDVGGQRSQRKKWIHCFDDVAAVIYVAAISEYNQKLREDNKTNRLLEAMKLFESVSKSPFLAKSSMILFLNKTDLFRVKIEEADVPLKTYFPTFTGVGRSYSAAVAYIEKEFRALKPPTEQPMYVYETCATNCHQVQDVVDSVINNIINTALKASGMLQ